MGLHSSHCSIITKFLDILAYIITYGVIMEVEKGEAVMVEIAA